MSDAPPQTINLDHHLLQSAATLDRTVDEVYPLLRLKAEATHILRYKVAYQLMEQILGLAQSVVRLTKIAAEVKVIRNRGKFSFALGASAGAKRVVQ
jgi:hypothetical protein